MHKVFTRLQFSVSNTGGRLPYLSEGGSGGAGDLVDGVNGYADDRGQSHGEADGQRPAGVDVVVVGDGLVLDHREDQNELQKERERGGRLERIILDQSSALTQVTKSKVMRWLLPPCERSAATNPHQLCLTRAGLRNVSGHYNKGIMKERQPI